MISKLMCEACRQHETDVIETTDDPNQPYHLCVTCHKRLRAYALLPIEWYNLASMHTPFKPLLHDDFYDEDGTACQPYEDIHMTELDRAPTLEVVQDELMRLLDFAVTRWFLEADVIHALKQHDPLETLYAVKTRFYGTQNVEIRSRMLEIVADVITTPASDWMRQLWREYDESLLYPLADATASSLPTEEGLEHVYLHLKAVSQKELPNAAFFCLYRFRSPLVLDWIESNCVTFDEHWGRLAAVSMPTWKRMKAWLEHERPLSLVALDTMVNCIEGYGGTYVDKFSPYILETFLHDIEPTLTKFEQSDSVPRVKRDVATIRKRQAEIFVP